MTITTEENTEINGVLLLDKHTGITSNKALTLVKKLFSQLFNQKIKAGHTGSLDPLATGMLPVCIGEATKFARFLLAADKEYIVTMQLGIETDTGDIDGNIIQRQDNLTDLQLNQATIKSIIDGFIGEYNQVPPIYSAIKKNGVAFYKLAQAAKKNGDSIEAIPKPAARPIKIYSIKLLNICSDNKLITLQVHCSKGTYIRSLVADIAQKMNCLATVKQLRRTAIGNFSAKNMLSLSQLDVSNSINLQHDLKHEILERLLPLETCLASLKTFKLANNLVVKLQQGQAVDIDNLSNHQATTAVPIAIVDANSNKLVGIGEITSDNKLIPKRLLKLA